ncbi:MAG: protein phosphatase CheZ [Micavibrio sp.]|nr:protein phosphatase CheZ [Micavibrio sp.]
MQPENKKTFEREKVVEIINSVLNKVEHGADDPKVILNELKDLQRIIEQTRAEVGAAQAGDISDKHIPTATDELDAVVANTADATGKIMDSCEAIDEIAGNLGEQGAVISGETIKIFEACSFQDITGQRITKVVSTLKTIEEKVSRLVNALGAAMPDAGSVSEGEDTRQGDERLLNGPQMSDKAISQDDIDKLLDSF